MLVMINKAKAWGGGGATGVRLWGVVAQVILKTSVHCNYCNICLFTSVLITVFIYLPMLWYTVFAAKTGHFINM